MTKMQKAGHKAWKTRRISETKRSHAAIEAWKTRRAVYGPMGHTKE